MIVNEDIVARVTWRWPESKPVTEIAQSYRLTSLLRGAPSLMLLKVEVVEGWIQIPLEIAAKLKGAEDGNVYRTMYKYEGIDQWYTTITPVRSEIGRDARDRVKNPAWCELMKFYVASEWREIEPMKVEELFHD